MVKHRISFQHAIHGLLHAFFTQPNFRIHLLFTVLAVGLSLFLGITKTECLIILFTIALVLVAEMINTAIESVTDLLTQKTNLQAKIAKDVAAGMVLLTAVLSVIIGLVIFIPYLWPSY